MCALRERDRRGPQRVHRLGPGRVELSSEKPGEEGAERKLAARDVETEARPRLLVRVPLERADDGSVAERLDDVDFPSKVDLLWTRGA